MRKLLYIFIIVLNSVLISAQDIIVVQGLVKDSETHQALQFVNIALLNKGIGTTTNSRGQFILKIPNEKKTDTIQISCLGYSSFSIPVNEIEDSLNISLYPKKFVINEIIVQYNDPTNIIKKALENFSENYYSTSHNLTAFYREIIKENQQEIEYAEALLKIYKGKKPGNFDYDKVRLLKGHIKPPDKKSIIWHYIRFIDGPYDLLKSDFVKNPKNFITVSQNNINFLNPNDFKFYNYSLLESFGLGNELYAIKFEPKPGKKKVVYEGIIYIDKKNYAIKGLEFKFNDENINSSQIIDYLTEQSLKEAGVILKSVDFSCFVEYKPYENKLIFSQANMKYTFVFLENITQELLYVTANSNMVITNIETNNIEKIGIKDQMKLRSELEENIKEIDLGFWEDYNYIKNE